MNELIDRTIKGLHKGIYYKFLGLVVSRQQTIGKEVSIVIGRYLLEQKVITEKEFKEMLKNG
jgi:hypothetical protein